MKSTAIIYSPRYLSHATGPNHPESPRRLETIIKGIDESGILEAGNLSLVSPRYASLKELELVHSSDYIKYVRQLSKSGGGILDKETETIVSKESFDIARLAVGGVLKAAETIMKREFQNAFVLLRPPGHHAGPDYGLGFCIFNNVAVAASQLQRSFGLERILILDIDSHHGNGTQEIFYSTDKVLYISLHEDPSEFPGTGFMNETGEGKGMGYTVNIPFPFKTGDPAYWKAIKTIVVPIICQYRPQFIFVSAGFDGYYRDSVGELSLSGYIYPRIFQMMLELAHRFCDGKLVAVLEGGYKFTFLRKIIPTIISQMAGSKIRFLDPRPPINPNIQRRAEIIIEKTRRVQSKFWEV
jgi:acetoin utilization deacetylase AcuC-like enzyme